MVSLWKIVVKVHIGQLEADIEEILDAVQREGFTSLDVGMPHLMALAKLPMHHRDSFDHLLIAQAVAEDATFISEDRNATRYLVRAISCSGKLA